ncbi:F0F1 ATP synthase subunit delta [Lipingzhangella sp. LS1_29]|uniref:ATP synthase subunit delta n=1 Tax=Lipingzhangella rawalii TaxID=2055835 RepID=A0ABU2H5A2_9ACTN|nr:F0F1 ATP synthase subunit delta [Lipingzhangella rawalii]MDS1270468.1 F0F1 ATP synthase subunit delta [Lipingzhangella rawalii]
MQGTSRASLNHVLRHVDTVLDSTDPEALATELFNVVQLLDAEHSLRRMLADTSSEADQRTGVVGQLLESRVSPTTILVVNEVVRASWSRPRDLADAMERLAVNALAASVESTGDLGELEDELFRFERLVQSQPELRDALTRPGVAAHRRRALVEELLEAKVSSAALRLIIQTVVAPRGRKLEKSLELYGSWVAERAQRRVAVVRTAVPLSDEQQQRLQRLLSEAYGRTVHMNIEVEPDVVGGMSIRIGDDVIDGSIAGKIAALRRRLAM